jgi:hypothetical protein
VAGALGTDIAYVFYVVAHLWICRQMMGMQLRPLALTLARVLVAAAAMSAVLLACGTGTVGLPVLVAGGIAASLVYAGALLLLREITIAEARAGLDWVILRVRRSD